MIYFFIYLLSPLVEYPWPQRAVEGTGLTVTDLKRCCLAIYDECLTDKNVILDYRKVKLESVTNRCACGKEYILIICVLVAIFEKL